MVINASDILIGFTNILNYGNEKNINERNIYPGIITIQLKIYELNKAFRD